MLGDPIAWLEANGAHRDVLDGLRTCSRDWRSLWRDCPRGDWLLGIAVRIGVDHASLVRAAIGCARTSLDRFEGGEAAALLDVAARFTTGDASEADVAIATRALDVAAAKVGDPSADAAARSAQAVGLGIVALDGSGRGDPETLVSAAALAAEATIVATMECGLELAMGWAHRACADAVRSAIPWEAAEPLIVAQTLPQG